MHDRSLSWLMKILPRHNSEIIVNFEPKCNSQYHLSLYVHNWQNTFQQGVKKLNIHEKKKNFHIKT